MNFSYEELSKLKFAAQKLLEAVHQIEAVNITTGGNDILVPESFLDEPNHICQGTQELKFQQYQQDKQLKCSMLQY